ncbi:MAG: hypothetical protein CSA62_06360 [Planctomycetota bacterium]|nr:MAG: hypothetical protein CSA62_06360 [Planctomycetota bacterium]
MSLGPGAMTAFRRAYPFAAGLFVFLLLALLWALFALGSEREAKQELAERSEGLAGQLDELHGQLDGLRGKLAAAESMLQDERELSAARITQLEQQLFRQREKARQLQAALARLAQEMTKPAAEAEPGFDPAEQSRQVEQLRELNTGLRAEGLGTLRFLDFARFADGSFHGVDLLRSDLEGIVRGNYHADELRLELDRASGILTLRMKGAIEIWRGKKRKLKDGHSLEFVVQEPKRLARSLESFLHLTKSWPKPEDSGAEQLAQREAWKERLDRLLQGARKEGRYEIYELGSVSGYEFRVVTLLGYSAKGVLERRLRAKKLRVHVDDASGRVELRFSEGFVEGREGRFEFGQEWYRLPLPGRKPSEARSLMTGAVYGF